MLNNPIIIGGSNLPTLTNPGTAGDLLSGKQLIGQNGDVVTGTMKAKSAIFIGINSGDSLTGPYLYSAETIPDEGISIELSLSEAGGEHFGWIASPPVTNSGLRPTSITDPVAKISVGSGSLTIRPISAGETKIGIYVIATELYTQSEIFWFHVTVTA